MLATIPTTRRSGESPASLVQRCPFCCDQIPSEAKKCRTCGEWVVGTSTGAASAGLRLLALLWAGLTILAAGGLWTVGQGIRRWVWLHAVNPDITPQLVDLALYALLALVVLKGFTVSVSLGLIARLAPRRPRR
ncbi:MAG TPA: hypothetical protein VGG78_07100 [Gemmatimonadaceae bacterium]|jgi:hypothetical protein